MKLGILRALHTMRRPKYLRTIIQLDGVKRLFTHVVFSKRNMIGRVPILSEYNILKMFRQVINDRYDFIAIWHSKIAIRSKAVLYIDDDQGCIFGVHYSTILNYQNIQFHFLTILARKRADHSQIYQTKTSIRNTII